MKVSFNSAKLVGNTAKPTVNITSNCIRTNIIVKLKAYAESNGNSFPVKNLHYHATDKHY